MGELLSGKGLLGWLGRQIGHVKRAVQTDVTAPQPKVLFRNERVSEATPGNATGVKLRRTVIDEVIADGTASLQPPESSADASQERGH